MSYLARDSAILSQRAVVLATIAAAHLLLLYFVASGLARMTINAFMGQTEARIVDEPVRPVAPPPPPGPTFAQPKVDLGPLPDLVSEPEADPGAALQSSANVPPAPIPAIPEPQVLPIRVIGKNQLPNNEDYYPADLRRQRIEGATTVRVCVDEKGKRQREPTVQESSGSPRLDAAAVNVARDGRYARSMQGEAFVPNCHGFRIIFKLSAH